MSAYTDADVEAAADAILDMFVGPDQEDRDRAWVDAKAALDAVVPAIVARAKAEALREEADRTYTHTTIGQKGERTKSLRPVWPERDRAILLDRADEIEHTAP